MPESNHKNQIPKTEGNCLNHASVTPSGLQSESFLLFVYRLMLTTVLRSYIHAANLFRAKQTREKRLAVKLLVLSAVLTSVHAKCDNFPFSELDIAHALVERSEIDEVLLSNGEDVGVVCSMISDVSGEIVAEIKEALMILSGDVEENPGPMVSVGEYIGHISKETLNEIISKGRESEKDIWLRLRIVDSWQVVKRQATFVETTFQTTCDPKHEDTEVKKKSKRRSDDSITNGAKKPKDKDKAREEMELNAERVINTRHGSVYSLLRLIRNEVLWNRSWGLCLARHAYNHKQHKTSFLLRGYLNKITSDTPDDSEWISLRDAYPGIFNDTIVTEYNDETAEPIVEHDLIRWKMDLTRQGIEPNPGPGPWYNIPVILQCFDGNVPDDIKEWYKDHSEICLTVMRTVAGFVDTTFWNRSETRRQHKTALCNAHILLENLGGCSCSTTAREKVLDEINLQLRKYVKNHVICEALFERKNAFNNYDYHFDITIFGDIEQNPGPKFTRQPHQVRNVLSKIIHPTDLAYILSIGDNVCRSIRNKWSVHMGVIISAGDIIHIHNAHDLVVKMGRCSCIDTDARLRGIVNYISDVTKDQTELRKIRDMLDAMLVNQDIDRRYGSICTEWDYVKDLTGCGDVESNPGPISLNLPVDDVKEVAVFYNNTLEEVIHDNGRLTDWDITELQTFAKWELMPWNSTLDNSYMSHCPKAFNSLPIAMLCDGGSVSAWQRQNVGFESSIFINVGVTGDNTNGSRYKIIMSAAASELSTGFRTNSTTSIATAMRTNNESVNMYSSTMFSGLLLQNIANYEERTSGEMYWFMWALYNTIFDAEPLVYSGTPDCVTNVVNDTFEVTFNANIPDIEVCWMNVSDFYNLYFGGVNAGGQVPGNIIPLEWFQINQTGTVIIPVDDEMRMTSTLLTSHFYARIGTQWLESVRKGEAEYVSELGIARRRTQTFCLGSKVNIVTPLRVLFVVCSPLDEGANLVISPMGNSIPVPYWTVGGGFQVGQVNANALAADFVGNHTVALRMQYGRYLAGKYGDLDEIRYAVEKAMLCCNFYIPPRSASNNPGNVTLERTGRNTAGLVANNLQSYVMTNAPNWLDNTGAYNARSTAAVWAPYNPNTMPWLADNLGANDQYRRFWSHELFTMTNAIGQNVDTRITTSLKTGININGRQIFNIASPNHIVEVLAGIRLCSLTPTTSGIVGPMNGLLNQRKLALMSDSLAWITDVLMEASRLPNSIFLHKIANVMRPANNIPYIYGGSRLEQYTKSVLSSAKQDYTMKSLMKGMFEIGTETEHPLGSVNYNNNIQQLVLPARANWPAGLDNFLNAEYTYAEFWIVPARVEWSKLCYFGILKKQPSDLGNIWNEYLPNWEPRPILNGNVPMNQHEIVELKGRYVNAMAFGTNLEGNNWIVQSQGDLMRNASKVNGAVQPWLVSIFWGHYDTYSVALAGNVNRTWIYQNPEVVCHSIFPWNPEQGSDMVLVTSMWTNWAFSNSIRHSGFFWSDNTNIWSKYSTYGCGVEAYTPFQSAMSKKMHAYMKNSMVGKNSSGSSSPLTESNAEQEADM